MARDTAGAGLFRSGEGTYDSRSLAGVWVQQPRPNETIMERSYTFLVGAPAESANVEMRLDEGDWRPCREFLGLWWCDWYRCGRGKHQIVARALKADGSQTLSDSVAFSVEFPA